MDANDTLYSRLLKIIRDNPVDVAIEKLLEKGFVFTRDEIEAAKLRFANDGAK